MMTDEYGMSIIDSLKLDNGFSYWSISGANESCLVRNPKLIDLIKVIALEEILIELSPKELCTDINDINLLDELSKICNKLEINFKYSRKKNINYKLKNNFISWLKASFRFITFFIEAIKIQSFNFVRKHKKESYGRSVLLVSYSDNYNLKSTSMHQTNYWQGIPEILEKEFDSIKWLHIHDKNTSGSKLSFCRFLETLENNENNNKSAFVSLDQFLSIGLILSALLDYLRFQKRFIKVEKIIEKNQPDQSINLWPFLNEAWTGSTKSGTAISLFVYMRLFEKFSKSCDEETIIFLFEGMPWEHIFIHSMRNNPKSKLFAYQHASIKSSDMRVISFRDNINSAEPFKAVDKILVNGLASMKRLVEMGFRESNLKPVEATRFNYLDNHNRYEAKKREATRVLILLEGIERIDRYMLKVIDKSEDSLIEKGDISVTIKPHPNGVVDVGEFIKSRSNRSIWKESKESLELALKSTDHVIASINSSACIEAYSLGIPLSFIWKKDELIRSSVPINDWSNIISSSDELKDIVGDVKIVSRENDLMFINLKNELWEALLKE
ncbi:hypothetical protein N9425_02690 [Gammaproteobacteria bacterium]|nr:hypothetical protein [Gammaproteobacteria bacterium]